jgi:DNA-binding NarL/FixJ family response regulator
MRTDLISEREWEQLRASLRLDRRQADVVRLIFLGQSDEEIARALAIRVRTVRTHVNHLFEAFGLSSRLQLVLLVLTSLRECWARAEPGGSDAEK